MVELLSLPCFYGGGPHIIVLVVQEIGDLFVALAEPGVKHRAAAHTQILESHQGTLLLLNKRVLNRDFRGEVLLQPEHDGSQPRHDGGLDGDAGGLDGDAGGTQQADC